MYYEYQERTEYSTHTSRRDTPQGFLPDFGLNVTGFARALGVTRQTVNELLRERRAVSPVMALRLSRLFGNTPEFWLNAQRAVDLCEAARIMKKGIERITQLNAS